MSPSPQPPPSEPDQTGPVRPPRPLLVAVGVVGLEALLLVGVGLFEVVVLSSARAVMGVSTIAFFLLYGVGLAWCGWRLARLASWARAPVVLAQLIQIPVAWSFRGGSTTLVAYALVVLAVAALVGIFHPASLRALSPEQDHG